MNTKVYNKGDVIFRQGDAAESMFDVQWGSVGIYLDYGTANEKKLAELSDDAFFGEMGMIDHAPRSATAVALENRTLLNEIAENDLAMLVRERPTKVLMIMQQLASRLRGLTKDYMKACKTAAGVVKLEEGGNGIPSEEEEDIQAQVERYANEKNFGRAL